MINRNRKKEILARLKHNASVVLIGPRQIGKSTLAREIAKTKDALYLDLDNPKNRSRAREISLLVEQNPKRLIILDEIQHTPEIFSEIRGIIDENRRNGHENGQFLFLGSSSLDLQKQTSQSLAGRISTIELSGINTIEIAKHKEPIDQDDLWYRGGFPRSLLAESDEESLAWRSDLISTYLERDLPQLGFRIPAETLRRFWTMVAFNQGHILNASALAKSMDSSSQSIVRYVDILKDILVLRRLEPWYANVKKRLIKSPKIYIRDSGLQHALLDIDSLDTLQSHPSLGMSWEGFVLENIISSLDRNRIQAYFYRTHDGAEIDLVLVRAGKPEIGIEIKRSSNPKIPRGFTSACDDLEIEHRYVVYPGKESYPLRNGQVWISSISDLMRTIENRDNMSFA